MRRYCLSDRHGGSRFRGFALAFTSLARELASKITSFMTVDCFSNMCSKQDVINAHAQWNVLETR